MINVFDLAVLLAYMFGRFPSLSLDPGVVSTGIQGRSGVHKRCGTGETYYDYASAFAVDNCVTTIPSPPSSPLLGDDGGAVRQRRLHNGDEGARQPAAPRRRLDVRTETFAETVSGKWYRISLKQAYGTLDLQLKSVRWPRTQEHRLELDNAPYPKTGEAPFLTEKQ
eukprot:844234-Pleurochrysis_carterae.AAC.1